MNKDHITKESIESFKKDLIVADKNRLRGVVLLKEINDAANKLHLQYNRFIPDSIILRFDIYNAILDEVLSRRSTLKYTKPNLDLDMLSVGAFGLLSVLIDLDKNCSPYRFVKLVTQYGE